MLKCNITAIYMIIYNLQHLHTNYVCMLSLIILYAKKYSLLADWWSEYQPGLYCLQYVYIDELLHTISV